MFLIAAVSIAAWTALKSGRFRSSGQIVLTRIAIRRLFEYPGIVVIVDPRIGNAFEPAAGRISRAGGQESRRSHHGHKRSSKTQSCPTNAAGKARHSAGPQGTLQMVGCGHTAQ